MTGASNSFSLFIDHPDTDEDDENRIPKKGG